ncbi:hypothetical protein [Streptomyces antnestii]|uniref:hypothetical protein n=1 Tax=Streptomyces antnestii TaxID=2494256 RepID=UPI001CB95423|nr:hypothetical protein [Streptomyces sp. San01]
MREAQKQFAGGVLAVTGGGSGVGEGLARYAASLGMAVAIADIDLDAATTVADELVRAVRGRRPTSSASTRCSP